MRHFLAAAALCIAATTAHGDEISETISSALQAYEEGDVQYALEELAYAMQQLKAIKAEGLTNFLPEAPDGWTRTLDDGFSSGMGMMGGGIGASAEYSNGSDNFTIMIMADNPMVASMAAMMGNAGLIGGKMVRIGREKFLDQDGDLTGLINNRVLVQAEGASKDIMMPLLETIDFRALKDF